jgi:hypothetical protein
VYVCVTAFEVVQGERDGEREREREEERMGDRKGREFAVRGFLGLLLING